MYTIMCHCSCNVGHHHCAIQLVASEPLSAQTLTLPFPSSSPVARLGTGLRCEHIFVGSRLPKAASEMSVLVDLKEFNTEQSVVTPVELFSHVVCT